MIGIFGGTFDPVHYGHLKPVRAVMQALELSQVRFIPNRVPPHRQSPWLSAPQRLCLLELALQDYPGFILDTRELNRDGPSYMVDTLKSLQQDFPHETLCLIIGLDVFAGFEQWFAWQSVLQYCHLVVMQRPGYDIASISIHETLKAAITADKKQLKAQASGQILIQLVPQLVISSTDIRGHLQHGQAVETLMPAKVYQQLKRFVPHD